VAAVPALFTHLLADFAGLSAARLTDATLVGGLVVAAASAAGMTAAGGAPLLRTLPHGGVTAVLFSDGCHLLVHTLPADGLLFLDVLVRGARPAADRAAAVFARRLGAPPVRAAAHARGEPTPP
jgi:S-adenosylmethionine/arginine decarboxylase-like enzyme